MQNKLFLPLVLILALVLRVISLNQSLWLDEATSILIARNFSFGEILSKFSPGDFHPPLYYLLLRVWMLIFGSTEIAARSLSVFLGVGTIFLAYLIVKNYLDQKIALVASLLMATAPLHIYYSQEARMYALATFLASFSVFLFQWVLSEARPIRCPQSQAPCGHSMGRPPLLPPTTKLVWIGFVLTNVLLLYTEYPAGFLLAAFFGFLLFSKKSNLSFNKLIISFSVIVILFLPWIPTMVSQLHTGLLAKVNAPVWWEVLGRVTAKEAALIPIKFTIGRISSFDKVFYYVSVGVLLSFVGFILAKSLKEYKKVSFFWFWLVVPIVLAAMFGIKLSIFKYFRLIFVLPAFYILIAWGLYTIKSNKFRVFLIVLVIAVNVFSSLTYLLNGRFHREGWRPAVSWIESNSKGKSASIFVTKNQRDPYNYYAKNIPAYGPEGILEGPFDTLWLVRYVQPIFDPQDKLRTQIEGMGYVKRNERDFNGVTVWQYEQTKNIFSSL